MYIDFLNTSRQPQTRAQDLRKIFFESTSKQFSSEAEREKFFNSWASPYLLHWPDYVMFACDQQSHKTLGYLTGCPNSLEAHSLLADKIKTYNVFSDLFKLYPAHLHINCAAESRSQGAGGFLIEEFAIEMRRQKAAGLHIVTSPEQRNVHFYHRHGFTFTKIRKYENYELMFMGRKL